jgi:hypothetical protein
MNGGCDYVSCAMTHQWFDTKIGWRNNAGCLAFVHRRRMKHNHFIFLRRPRRRIVENARLYVRFLECRGATNGKDQGSARAHDRRLDRRIVRIGHVVGSRIGAGRHGRKHERNRSNEYGCNEYSSGGRDYERSQRERREHERSSGCDCGKSWPGWWPWGWWRR